MSNRVLVVDSEGMGLPFVMRAAEAGWSVRWFKYIAPGKFDRAGEGMTGFKIIDDWESSMPWVGKDGLVINTGNWRYTQRLDYYRDLGYRVYGPSAKSAELEIKRGLGMKAMESVGIPVPPYHEFKTLEDAEAFARKSDDCWVFKPGGDNGNKALSMVSSDPAELVGWLRQKIASGISLKDGCFLQEKIDQMCEFGVSSFMGPQGFLRDRVGENIEHKRLHSGEIGPNTGEQGNVQFWEDKSRIADECLFPLEPILLALGHRGDFAVGLGIDSKGRPWGYEVTARAGYPAWFQQIASIKGDPVQWMSDLLDGKDSLKVDRRATIAVVLSQPCYPYGRATASEVEGHPITGIDDHMDDLHLCSVMIGRGPMMKSGKIVEGPQFQTTGELVMVATGVGNTITQASKRVYETCSDVKYPDKSYRDDVGEKVIDCLDVLHRHDIALGLQA